MQLETDGSQSTKRVGAGHVKITIEGDEKYLCYDNTTWRELLGDVICNEYGFGYGCLFYLLKYIKSPGRGFHKEVGLVLSRVRTSY